MRHEFFYILVNSLFAICRTKSARRFGGFRSHVYVLPARKPTVAGAKGRYTERTLPEDWGHQTGHPHRGPV